MVNKIPVFLDVAPLPPASDFQILAKPQLFRMALKPSRIHLRFTGFGLRINPARDEACAPSFIYHAPYAVETAPCGNIFELVYEIAHCSLLAQGHSS